MPDVVGANPCVRPCIRAGTGTCPTPKPGNLFFGKSLTNPNVTLKVMGDLWPAFLTPDRNPPAD